MNWIHAFEFAGVAAVFFGYINFCAVVVDRMAEKHDWAPVLLFPLLFVPILFLIGLFS